MKFDFDITKKESKNSFGDPPPSGLYLLLITEFEDFTADSGTTGVNPTFKILKSSADKDATKFQGRTCRPTLWTNEKNGGRFRSFLDTAKIPYSASGMENSDAIGKAFWGRINSYIEDGFARADLLTWEAAKPEQVKEFSGLIAEWLNKDTPPSDVAKSDTSPPPRSGSGRAPTEKIDGGDDENLPF